MKRKRIYLLLFCSFLFSTGAIAQKSTANPLHQLTHKAYTYYLNKPDSAIKLTQKALDMAIQSKDVYYEGYCYFIFSKAYWVKANFKLSTEYGFRALKFFQHSPISRSSVLVFCHWDGLL